MRMRTKTEGERGGARLAALTESSPELWPWRTHVREEEEPKGHYLCFVGGEGELASVEQREAKELGASRNGGAGPEAELHSGAAMVPVALLLREGKSRPRREE
jgi:hypothetical protein